MIFSKHLIPFAAGVLVAGLSTVSASYFPQFNQDPAGDAGIVTGGVDQIHVTTSAIASSGSGARTIFSEK